MNIGTVYQALAIVCHQIGEFVQVATSSQVLCSTVIGTAFTFVASCSGNDEGSGSRLQHRSTECKLSPTICSYTKMLLSRLVIDSIINLVLDAVPKLLLCGQILFSCRGIVTYSTSASCRLLIFEFLSLNLNTGQSAQLSKNRG